ncbi:MAG TPA: amidohydrolase family protein [Polyangia bacterium]|jgi:dihydropyrimidinase|nr:amidohydrolase family protein [Polyangia bacterium]
MADPLLDLVVRGGIVVTAEGRQRADIGVAGGRVAQLGGAMSGARELDAEGRFVLPGGVDPHVHLNVEQVDPGEPDWVDDYTSGSQAALAGGVTTVGNMSYVLPWETIADRVRAESALVARQAIADVFFHAVVLTPTPEIVAEVAPAVAAGQSSMKIFMCLPSFDACAQDFTRLMAATGGAGGLTLIHCEDLATIECCTAVLTSRAHTTTAHFAESRPVASEAIAVERAIAMCRATGAPTYIVHLSSAAALAAAATARAEGLPLFVETRPLYLYLTEERYRDADGGIYVAQPPLRSDADREALWRGIADGTVDTLASDHAPWTRALKLDPKLDLMHPRPGVAELDTMLPLFFTEAVAKERITLERFVALTATNAARLCGLYPRKGTIAVGSDADLVIWQTRAQRIVRDESLFSRAGHSVYAGRPLSAWPETTIRRGEVVFEDGRVVGRPGSGQVVPRRGTQSPR